MSHIQVLAAHTAEEALRAIHQAGCNHCTRLGGAVNGKDGEAAVVATSAHGFDMIIVEEQLCPAPTNAESVADSNDTAS
eukprot:11677161-Ditylum_brightwellii.AAC.1